MKPEWQVAIISQPVDIDFVAQAPRDVRWVTKRLEDGVRGVVSRHGKIALDGTVGKALQETAKRMFSDIVL